MNFIEEILANLNFTAEQRTEAVKDLDSFIKAETTNQLINHLPNELKQIQGNSDANSIAVSIKQHFSEKDIEESKQRAIGVVILSYLAFMLKDITAEQAEKIKAIFIKYNISISSP